jgi:peptidyl-prolyl cis-trans isomerase D
MFDFVQEKKRFVYVILGLIVLPFAFFGVSSYKDAANVESLATVNGVKVSAQELDNSLRQQQEQLRQRMGSSFDPALFDTPEMKRAVLDNLVAQGLLAERAKAAGLTVTDEMVAQLIGSVEAFQSDGKFDKKRYETVLANNNLSPLMYEARVRDELVRQQLNETYTQNGYASDTAAEKIIALNEQQRVISVASVPLQALMAQVKVEPAAIKKYYDENAKEFAVPEQVKVEYVKFSTGNLTANVDVTTEDVRKFYDEHQADFGRPEQRQAAHILINVAATAPQVEQDAAKAKAEMVLAQVKQNPAKFAELAKQYSQDPGSAAKGGDLGLFGRGMMVKPFEDAVFSLKQGEISALVKSDFGYHIIKVTAIKPARVLPFDEVRESIVNKLRQQKAGEKFAELAEKFSNTVYEQSDTLKPAAEIAGAKIEESGWLVKGMPSVEPWNTKILQAVFSEDVMKNKRNTPAIEVAPSTLVAARMLEYKPASVKPLSEVQAVIQQKLLREQAVTLAVQQGKAALDQLQKTGKTALSWALVRLVFQANAAKLPQYVGTEVAQGGYTIVRVDAVKAGDKPNEAKHASYVKQLRQLSGDELFQAYLADAKAHATIKVNLPDTAKTKVE